MLAQIKGVNEIKSLCSKKCAYDKAVIDKMDKLYRQVPERNEEPETCEIGVGIEGCFRGSWNERSRFLRPNTAISA